MGLLSPVQPTNTPTFPILTVTDILKKKIYEMFKHDNQYGYQYKYNTSKNSSRFDFKIAKFRINCHSRCLVGHHARLVFTRFRFLLSSLLS